MWVEVVGGRDAEIERGWRVLTQKGGYRVHVFIIARPLKTNGWGCRGCMCDEVGVVIGATAYYIGEIAQGQVLGCKIKNRTSQAQFWSEMRK
jgi:hypothetical protein